MCVLLRFNNSLLGQLLIGPLIGQFMWMASDLRVCHADARGVIRGCVAHVPAVAMVVALIWATPLPF
jgi:hypothetical protein